MTELVIHTGMPLTSISRVRMQLVACREPLERAGVALVGKDGRKAWDRAVRQVLGGEAPPVLKRIIRRKLQSELSTVLLSSKPAAGALASFTNVMALRAFSRDHSVPVKVVLVVREQLDLLNALYCRDVMALETAVSFERFITETIAGTALELGVQYAALLDDTEVQVVAVPYSQLDARLPAAAILAAAGLPGSSALEDSRAADAAPAPVADDRWLPGPVLLTATRLLHKRLTRLGVVRRRPPEDLVAAAAVMREHAEANGWDDETFWGWSAERAAFVAGHFAPGNAIFAARAWGTPWPDVAPERAPTRQDLAAAPPHVVADAMTMIHRVVDELVTVDRHTPDAASDEPASDEPASGDAVSGDGASDDAAPAEKGPQWSSGS